MKISKKNILIGIIVCIILFIIIASIYFYINNKKTDKKYQLLTLTFLSVYNDLTEYQSQYLLLQINLIELNDNISIYWHDSIFKDKHNNDINQAISDYKKDFESKIDETKDQYNKFVKIYKKIRTNECENDECENIQSKSYKLKKAVTKYYDLIIFPSGNYNNFVDNSSDYYDESQSEYDDLEDMSEDFFEKYVES